MTEQPTPAASDLSAEVVNRLERLADIARAEIDMDLADRPGAAAGMSEGAQAALDALRDGYVEAGTSTLRADRAVTAWMILRRVSIVRALDEADAGAWRQPGDSPGGLGLR